MLEGRQLGVKVHLKILVYAFVWERLELYIMAMARLKAGDQVGLAKGVGWWAGAWWGVVER